MDAKLPLSGLKVLELGQLIAGPFTTRILAEFGAEVVKVEPPGKGDPLRHWRYMYKGFSLWWRVQSRNKKSITVNLKDPDGQKVIKDLVKECDILVENFRPGTLEKWNLGYEELSAINPRLIMVRVSGYGQTGPYRDKPGFGSVGEAMGGIRHLTGYPDRPPTRVGISLGDSLAALYAVIGTLMAVYCRDVKKSGKGQVVDVALYEAVFSLMESMVPEYDKYRYVRERTGSVLPGIAPSNTYVCRDGKYIVIGGNGDSIFKRLMRAIGRQDLADDPRLEDNSGRVKHMEMIDRAIEAWTRNKTLKEALEWMDKHQVPAGSIYSVEDMMGDPHFLERGMIEEFPLNGETLKVPGIVPKLSDTPGQTRWLGPELGEHTERVLKEWAGYDDEKIEELKRKGTISTPADPKPAPS
ncbi:formyl-CoA transferase [Planifilum fimeticola]|uniref:Formyl-CoA transferase n=1 Tax=Planifilum fimeticola TaxID=201975 RepID=A0A2T0LG44_9BACL|nr:CoA transferase [Planifilum fimeticola]PRX41242.1 formyl-CoA transferase [Planifilum fimeticola]